MLRVLDCYNHMRMLCRCGKFGEFDIATLNLHPLSGESEEMKY
jgi:hypothetical protein